MTPSVMEREKSILTESGRFYGEVGRKFAGAPHPMLQEMDKRIRDMQRPL